MKRSLNPIPPRSVVKDLAGHFQKVQVPRGQLGAVDTPDTTMCGGNKKQPRENMNIHGGKRSKLAIEALLIRAMVLYQFALFNFE